MSDRHGNCYFELRPNRLATIFCPCDWYFMRKVQLFNDNWLSLSLICMPVTCITFLLQRQILSFSFMQSTFMLYKEHISSRLHIHYIQNNIFIMCYNYAKTLRLKHFMLLTAPMPTALKIFVTNNNSAFQERENLFHGKTVHAAYRAESSMKKRNPSWNNIAFVWERPFKGCKRIHLTFICNYNWSFLDLILIFLYWGTFKKWPWNHFTKSETTFFYKQHIIVNISTYIN